MIKAKTPFVTIRKASQATGLSERLLRDMVRDGACPGIYSGNRFLVDTEMLIRRLRGETEKEGA